MNSYNISLKNIFLRFKYRLSFTFILIVLEAVAFLLFPLFVGYAINDLQVGSNGGLFYLGGLGIVSLILGSGRRYFDTRTYANIYQVITTELVKNETRKKESDSKISARVTLINEFTEFLENSLPEIFSSVIGLVGVLIIIFGINKQVFGLALISFVLIIGIYLFSTKKSLHLNKMYNDTFEEQGDYISNKRKQTSRYFKKLMNWNIKISDLETRNFSFVWILMIGLIVASVHIILNSGITEFGTIFTAVSYVINFTEYAVTLPLFYLQIIRLKEITNRLN